MAHGTSEISREAARKRSAEWRLKYPERVKALSLVSRSRRKLNWDKFLESEHRRYRRNREKILARQLARRITHRDVVNEIQRKHYRANKHKAVANTALYRARKLKATPPWVNKKELIAIYQLAKKVSEQTGTLHHVDHVFPLKGRNSCGLHVPWNLQLLTAEENKRKFNRE